MTVRTVEVESLADFDTRVARATRLAGWFVSSVDLTARGDVLREVDPEGAVFLGCRLADDDVEVLRGRGAVVFPRLPDLPFDPYRARLYTAEELFGLTHQTSTAGGERPPYESSPDSVVYAWSKSPAGRTLTANLAATLHDHAITEALDDATAGLDPRRVVGVMGGHALRRGEQGYAQAAELGAALTRAGRTVLTGGGPGAMEAANLGAYLSPWDDALAPALDLLAAAPGYAGDTGSSGAATIDTWASAAFEVRRRWPVERAAASVSVPTWFYGHEPTNVFGTVIAKYFANALREDTLLHRCRGGIVYLPGQSGTVQEVFQAANENFYVADPAAVAPLVLLGVRQWTQTLPAWSLLQTLAQGSPMADAVHCVDTVEEAVALLTRPATPPPGSPG